MTKFADVIVGAELPLVSYPVNRLSLVKYCGASGDFNVIHWNERIARSVGLPARDIYGIRVAKSEFGYRSLGAGTSNITKAQHCRAEVFLTGFGWVPVDPADVRKVIDGYQYLDDWRVNYRIQSVRSSLFAPRITCSRGNSSFSVTASTGPR